MLALIALVAALHLTPADNHKTFTVEPHTPIVLTLPANPSTGYRWIWEVAMDVPTDFRLVAHRYVAPKKTLPGAPGKEVWRFVTTTKGSAWLQFGYERSWQPKRMARTVSIRIRVS